MVRERYTGQEVAHEFTTRRLPLGLWLATVHGTIHPGFTREDEIAAGRPLPRLGTGFDWCPSITRLGFTERQARRRALAESMSRVRPSVARQVALPAPPDGNGA